jgi:uncharacterized small protein (DUF1192 family)
MKHLEQQLKKVLNAILVQSHINYLQSEIERLEREIQMTDENNIGYEAALQIEINHKRQEIINANKLL